MPSGSLESSGDGRVCTTIADLIALLDAKEVPRQIIPTADGTLSCKFSEKAKATDPWQPWPLKAWSPIDGKIVLAQTTGSSGGAPFMVLF